jgi:MFS family permease
VHSQLKWVLLASSLAALGSRMLAPFYAVYVADIGGDLLAAGGTAAVFGIGTGIGIYCMGLVQDRIHRDKPVMILGTGLECAGFLGYYFVSNIYQLFALQCVLAFAYVVYTPAYYRFYTSYVKDDHAASEWGAWDAITYVATGISALLGAYVVDRFGFEALFLCMFGVAFVGLCLIVFALKEPPSALAEVR